MATCSSDGAKQTNAASAGALLIKPLEDVAADKWAAPAPQFSGLPN